MTDHLVRRYSESDLERARAKGQMIGRIPGLLLGLALGFVAWKLLRR